MRTDLEIVCSAISLAALQRATSAGTVVVSVDRLDLPYKAIGRTTDNCTFINQHVQSDKQRGPSPRTWYFDAQLVSLSRQQSRPTEADL